MKIALKLGIVALVFGLGMGGCMQMEQTTTLYPDGSGKLVMTIGLKKSMIAQIEMMAKGFGAPEGEDEGEDTDFFDGVTDPVQLDANSEGIVAWGKSKKEDVGEWIRVTTTGYFEDINKVKIYNSQAAVAGQPGGGEKKLAFACKVERTTDGYTLVMKNDSGEALEQIPGGGGEGGEQAQEQARMMAEVMKPMLEGMKIRFAVTVPGKITKSKGFMEYKGRTATISMNGDTMIEMMTNPDGEEAKKVKEFAEAGEGRLSWAENDVPEAEITKFKAELEAAKKSWKKRLKKAKKAAGKTEKQTDF